MTIHKEGRKLLFWLLVILTGINLATHQMMPGQETVLNLILLGSIIIYLLVLQFFRNPTIPLPDDESIVYAPADGKVVVIEESEEEEYLKKRCKQISIFMSPINVHVNRSPVSGFVEYFKYHPGKYLVAWHPKSSFENERTTMVAAQWGEIARKTDRLWQEGLKIMSRKGLRSSREGNLVSSNSVPGWMFLCLWMQKFS